MMAKNERALSLASCVTVGKLLSLSETQCPYPQNGRCMASIVVLNRMLAACCCYSHSTL